MRSSSEASGEDGPPDRDLRLGPEAGREEHQPLDVVEVQVGEQDVDPAAGVEVEPEAADPGAGVEDQLLAAGQGHLHARGVAAVAVHVRPGGRDRAARAPDLELHAVSVLAQRPEEDHRARRSPPRRRRSGRRSPRSSCRSPSRGVDREGRVRRGARARIASVRRKRVDLDRAAAARRRGRRRLVHCSASMRPASSNERPSRARGGLVVEDDRRLVVEQERRASRCWSAGSGPGSARAASAVVGSPCAWRPILPPIAPIHTCPRAGRAAPGAGSEGASVALAVRGSEVCALRDGWRGLGALWPRGCRSGRKTSSVRTKGAHRERVAENDGLFERNPPVGARRPIPSRPGDTCTRIEAQTPRVAAHLHPYPAKQRQSPRSTPSNSRRAVTYGSCRGPEGPRLSVVRPRACRS